MYDKIAKIKCYLKHCPTVQIWENHIKCCMKGCYEMQYIQSKNMTVYHLIDILCIYAILHVFIALLIT